MTKAEDLGRRLVALKRITSPFGKVGDRTKRQLEKAAEEAYKLCRDREPVLPEDSGIKLGLRWEDQNKARGMALGIREFEQAYPEEGKILRGMISEHRLSRRAHIQFGISSQFGILSDDLPLDFYIDLLEELGLSRKQAMVVYEASVALGDDLKGKRSSYYECLRVE